MARRPKPELTEWPVDKLKTHPKQDAHFGRRSQEELEALAELIRRNGMDPIDITPQGVILSGHQRRDIAKYILKRSNVPVRIRHDLAFDGPAAEELYFIEANAANRRMSKLQQVRNFEREVEIEQKKRKEAKAKGEVVPGGRVRDEVAKLYGLSRRTLADWAPILRLPLAVQKVVEAKHLTRADAMRVLDAPPKVQRQIASDLTAAKMPAKKILQRYLGRPKRAPLSQADLARCWNDFWRSASKLFHCRPESFAAMPAEARKNVEFALEFAELARQHFAAGKIAQQDDTGKIKLRPRALKGEKQPAPETEQPVQIKLKPKGPVAA